ncbi:hypothetical protein ASD45_07830 [Pseudolabrys sp. Root1462]|jgi:hypothetical protein|nr:hypothetical protein ASD45_07830 [Pseudolabrys sp. Root1462]
MEVTMKKLIIAAVTTALVASVAPAMAAGKKHHAKRYHHHVTRDGYYVPGIPKRDPGRYSNLPGKDAQYSKAYIRDH